MNRAWAFGAGLLMLSVPIIVGAVPTVHCEPETITVDSAEVFQVGVMVTDLDTLANFQVIFTYDCTVLEFVGAHEGSLYANSGFQTWFSVEEESLGTWEVWDVIFPALTYLLPPGELCRLEFRALRNGLSPIEFLSVALTDRYREAVDPLVWRDGFVIVGDLAGIENGGPGSLPNVGFPWPNPTWGGVTVPIYLCEEARGRRISACVYDSLGRLVAGPTGVMETTGPGLVWDGYDSKGVKVPAGVYYVRVSGPEANTVRKVVVIE